MTAGLTLALDGSTYAGSVAVIRDEAVIAERSLDDVPKPGRGGREELFLPMVAQCLADAGAKPADLARVVCGEGPGSFTSLRVAASIAKGIAVGTGIPLFALSSLMLIVAGRPASAGVWLAALPAMRGEMFVAPFEVMADGKIVQTGEPSLFPESQLDPQAEKMGAPVIGPSIDSSWAPHARGVVHVLADIVAAGACDLDTWEPAYGRLAEAQVRWEAAHGRRLTAAG
ncbi:MAG: tRNA (adenosine(37)-N6)-threonylcarbamoyltransferase complex dimerization subunit type 1 TsaB [Gemmatimonadales bacterium]